MCNYSDGIWMKGMEQGIERGMKQGIERGMEKGIEQGIEQERINTICKMIDKRFERDIIFGFGYTEEEYRKAYNQIKGNVIDNVL